MHELIARRDSFTRVDEALELSDSPVVATDSRHGHNLLGEGFDWQLAVERVQSLRKQTRFAHRQSSRGPALTPISEVHMILTDISRLGALALGSMLLRQASAPTKPAESIEQVATLHVARAAYTATTLRSGQVLVVGGMTGSGDALAAVELFDPATHTSRSLESLAERRIDHTATLLGDGRVLIAGGYNGDYLRSLEIFDPSSRRFRPSGTLVEERSGHTATLLPDGRVLIVGGVGRGWTFLRSAELYDPAAGRSESVGSMSVPRESHTATLLADGRVLIVGGHNGRRQDMQVHASAEIFSPATRRFEPAGTLATARHKHDAIKLVDGRVLVVGGADRSDRVYFKTTEIYDPAAGKFVAGPSMAHSRYKIAGTSILLPTATSSSPPVRNARSCWMSEPERSERSPAAFPRHIASRPRRALTAMRCSSPAATRTAMRLPQASGDSVADRREPGAIPL